jgi:hypothetical protein
MAMVLLTSFGLGIAPSAVQAQSPRASLTIHSRFCPPDYDMSDIYNDCHDTIGNRGVLFSARSRVAEVGFNQFPDTDGNLTFDNLGAGEYTLRSSHEEGRMKQLVYCSSGDGSNGDWIDHQPTEYGWGAYDIILGAGEAMTCDWYGIPQNDDLTTYASISIRDRFCPADYVDFGSEWRDCLDAPGPNLIKYAANGPTPREVTLHQGNLVFSRLEPGTYTLSSDMASYWNWNFDGVVYCSTWESGGEPFLSQTTAPGGTITMTLDPGGNVICDWYHYPPAEFYQTTAVDPLSSDGNTSIAVMACDYPTQFAQFSGNSYPQCEPVHGVHLTAYPTNDPRFAQICVYDGYSTCSLNLYGLIPITVEMYERDVPEGWTPLCNPCTWWQYGEWTGFIIQLVPIEE